MNDTDIQDAIGYHDYTINGMPLGKVFVRTSVNDNVSPWTVASHETLEMLSDSDISLTAFVDDGMNGKIYAYENCDPVEESIYYIISGTKKYAMSNFVTPKWFEGFWGTRGAKFDFLRDLTNPLTLLSGGYAIFLDLNDIGAGWQEIFANKKLNLTDHAKGIAEQDSFTINKNKIYPKGSRRYKILSRNKHI